MAACDRATAARDGVAARSALCVKHRRCPGGQPTAFVRSIGARAPRRRPMCMFSPGTQTMPSGRGFGLRAERRAPSRCRRTYTSVWRPTRRWAPQRDARRRRRDRRGVGARSDPPQQRHPAHTHTHIHMRGVNASPRVGRGNLAHVDRQWLSRGCQPPHVVQWRVHPALWRNIEQLTSRER